jgi:D-aminopeptidase
MQRARARDIGAVPGVFATGACNAITDVPGVRVGHATRIEGDAIRTGVTAIHAHGGNAFFERVPAAVHVGNGFGKLAGSTQVNELGELETPIVLTNTLAVWRAADALAQWMLAQPGMQDVRSINPLVGETNDGVLNAIRECHVTPRMVHDALDEASNGPVAEGCVGAGTGCVAFGFKGGIGTSSRVLPASLGGYGVGVLLQANFGGVLDVVGVPVGIELGRHAFSAHTARTSADGSVMIVVATDAPLDSRNLSRLAARAMMGLGRTGSCAANGSGDYVIAFSNSPHVRRARDAKLHETRALANGEMSALFQAVVEATEESVYNALLQATTMSGNGATVEALPLDRVRELLARRGIHPSGPIHSPR